MFAVRTLKNSNREYKIGKKVTQFYYLSYHVLGEKYSHKREDMTRRRLSDTLLTRSVGTKVQESEYQYLNRVAKVKGQNPSQLLRTALVEFLAQIKETPTA